ncbi:MAG TPA: hypothetical protein VF557_17125 [Jatrophihabitans sp.]|jgi:hypothetical protein|uniref:hypothetical protein n=1 Tax=Jatrophihabitans sp. TaxID=1932789 RepID=UPI002EE3E7E5
MIDYDGRRFSPVTESSGPAPVAQYHQQQDLIWGEFSGGEVRRGSLAGTCDAEGVVQFAYCMVLTSGEAVTGLCRSIPQVLADGRIRLTEYWERFGSGASNGVSTLEELPHSANAPLQHQ